MYENERLKKRFTFYFFHLYSLESVCHFKYFNYRQLRMTLIRIIRVYQSTMCPNFFSVGKTVYYKNALSTVPIKSRSVTSRQHRWFSATLQVRWPPPTPVYLVKIPPRRRMNSTNFTQRYATFQWSWCLFVYDAAGKTIADSLFVISRK